MNKCTACGTRPAARVLSLCPDCLRITERADLLLQSHMDSRRKFGLPGRPPLSSMSTRCRQCANECRPEPEELGYCGLRLNRGGRLVSVESPPVALAHIYLDPLPTNCCAAWFCKGSKERGYNLAVFFYGCSFDCLFCQNSSHKRLGEAPRLTETQIVSAALAPEVRCVCFFGGSPEPHLPFAIRVSRRIIRLSGNSKRICWEWNGSGHPVLVRKAAELASASGGTVKFDLKTSSSRLSLALCGVENRRTYENFSLLAQLFPRNDLLTATTLLVPYYIDAREVGEIARFIARLDPDIPYSSRVFHPDYLMTDLPVTPRGQVDECFAEASRYLSRVNVGNLHLL